MRHSSWQHWDYQKDESGFIWLRFDKADSSTNTLDKATLTELDAILSDIQTETANGLIITSAKQSSFIVGADINQFSQDSAISDIADVINLGLQVFSKLEKSTIPTVAMIKGHCLGGGLELALSCDYRIACSDVSTQLGLPEVMLGLHPGWGGTVRLPRLIGAVQALPLMLQGRFVSALKAAKLGIVDYAVPERNFDDAAKGILLKRSAKKTAPVYDVLFKLNLCRRIFAKYIRHKLNQMISNKHYPAPYAVLHNWQELGASDLAYQRETASFLELVKTDTCRNLVRVYHLQERLKHFADSKATKIKHVHVIGAGVMGGDIAAWCALQGMQVTIQDPCRKQIATTIKRAKKLYERKLKKTNKVRSVLDKLIPDVDGAGVQFADIVIEAALEKLDVKIDIFNKVLEKCKPECIIATNTSSIPLQDIASKLSCPERLVGIHFFNPVAKMQLVEVVNGEQTSPAIFDKATNFVGQIKKLPLPVKSAPGFLVNRILTPYLLEAVGLMAKGYTPSQIDQAALEFGMAMGPITMADTVGLDICLKVAENLLSDTKQNIPELLLEKVQRNQLGKKTGAGFYTYRKDKSSRTKTELTVKQQNDIISSLLTAIHDESLSALGDGIVADADLLDAGMIFGTGFAPFRGGPMHYDVESKNCE